MKQTNRLRRALLLLVMGLLCLAGPAAAQEGSDPNPNEPGSSRGIGLSVRAGFDGLHKGTGWLPVQIEVSNSGPPVEGMIGIGQRQSGRPVYQLPISLPTQANKRISTQVNGADFPSGLVVTLQSGSGQILATASSNPVKALRGDHSLLYAVVSSRPEALEHLEKVGGGRLDVGVAFLDLDDLPANPAIWREIDVVIFNDVDTNRLSAAQRQALESWLHLGGQLVVTGGAGWQKTTAAVADWLPVAVSGSESMANLPALADQAGEPFRDPGPYVVAASTLRDGELLFHEQGLPIVARRPLGRGAVYFLALDPQFAPLIDWGGNGRLWQAIVSGAPWPAIWETGFADENEAAGAVSTLPSLVLPSAFLLFCFIGLYIILIGPANYIALRRYGRRELAWVTIPVGILLFSFAAYLIGLRFKGNSVVINQIAMVSGRLGQPQAYVESAVAVYSPRRSAYDIVFDSDALVRRLSSFSGGSGADELFIDQGNEIIIKNKLIDVGGIETYDAAAVRELPPFDGVVRLFEKDGQTRAAITIANHSNAELQNAVLLFDDRALTLGAIAPGETVSREVTVGPAVAAAMRATARGGPVTYIQYADGGGTTLTSPAGIGAAPLPVGPGSTYKPSPLEPFYTNLLGTGSYYGDREIYPRFQFLESLYDNYSSLPAYHPESIFLLTGWTQESLVGVGIKGGRAERSAATIYFLEIPFE